MALQLFRSFFSFSSARISLSPCSFLLHPSRLWGLFLVPLVSVFYAVVARVIPRSFSCGMLVDFAQFLCGYLPVCSFPPSWWGPAIGVFLGALSVHSSGLSGALSGLPGSLLCLPPGYGSSSFAVPCGLVGASATFHATLRSASLWLLGCSTVSSLGVSLVCAFIPSRLLCSLASWLVLVSSCSVLVVLQLPPLQGALFGFWLLT